MTILTVIHLNGPINSGKTTIGLALARLLPDARFIDGDDHDAPEDAPFDVQWAIALERLVTQIADARERHLVIAYPIGEAEFERLRAACDARDARLFVVTLAPPEAVAASNRGSRALTDWERNRIAEMYREGYAARTFSDCIMDTSLSPPDACAADIVRYVAAPGSSSRSAGVTPSAST
ncbi:AAA family ATPase [Burkholderia cenocepacia]|uniref:AAA family ATPase n=1 Tax=Burkholderia cenocepacia TaxID=95486 RepID=UPI001CF3B9AF|nr:AAA family ATPase [Burkholderia cenocepacia]MCA8085043.1 AAA family ATPase [Burkholderia cenocepacia]